MADATVTAILPSDHFHPCPRCSGFPECAAACAVEQENWGGEVFALGVSITCRACRTKPADGDPHNLRMGGLASTVALFVDELKAEGYTPREIAQALDGARAALVSKKAQHATMGGNGTEGNE